MRVIGAYLHEPWNFIFQRVVCLTRRLRAQARLATLRVIHQRALAIRRENRRRDRSSGCALELCTPREYASHRYIVRRGTRRGRLFLSYISWKRYLAAGTRYMPKQQKGKRHNGRVKVKRG